ncbi:MAG: hypothetical protein PHN35_05015 [Clostridia bacterium]|nr:hypothetical protein [Clostridia bacterium]MDD4798929.1 hypothetical protein [Clostridia bacterium]
MPQISRIITLTSALLLLVLGLIAYELIDKTPPEQTLPAVEQGNYITADTPVNYEVYYSCCRHRICEQVTGDVRFAGKSFKELQDEGYQPFWSEYGTVTVFIEKNTLCPEDCKKCHLRIVGDSLFLFQGPVGTNGEALQKIDIDIHKLPDQQIIRLAKGQDFADMERAIAALDSLDEY